MKRQINKLNPRALTAVRQPLAAGLHPDGGGLYLEVDPPLENGELGGRRWVFLYYRRLNGDESSRRRQIGLGPLRSVSLERARELAAMARDALERGIDPKAVRDADREAARAASPTVLTFVEHALVVVESKQRTWRGRKTKARWLNAINKHCAGILNVPIAEIQTAHVMAVLEPIWWTIPEMAQKTQGVIEQVLNSARALNLRAGDNPAAWSGHLETLLHERPKATRGAHRAIAASRVPAFMARLRDGEGVSRKALELVVLTGARGVEVREARLSEFNLRLGVWSIPRDRTKEFKVLEKARVSHKRIPLGRSAIELLKPLLHDATQRGRDAFVFPGPQEGKALGYNAMNQLLEGMNVDATPHGFRSTFRDWAAEQRISLPTGRKVPLYSWEACEISLGHSVGNETSRAYFRGDLFDERRDLMADWDDFCNGRERAALDTTPANDVGARISEFLSLDPLLMARWEAFLAQKRVA